jgi:phage gp45-like
MASRSGTAAFAHMLNVGFDIMSVALDAVTKAIVAQIGDSTNENVDHDAAEWWQHTGFASMPAPPTQGASSCQGIAIKHSDRDMIIASRDLRGSMIYGNLKPGETCVYASSGAARVLLKRDGSIALYTTVDNTPTGTSISFILSPTEGVILATPWGGFTLTPGNGWVITGPGSAALTLSALTATLAGTQVEVNGSLVAVSGTIGTFLGPLATPTPVTAALHGPVGLAGVASTTVFISP